MNCAKEGASTTEAGRLFQCIMVLGKKLNLIWSEDGWYRLSCEECFDLTVIDRLVRYLDSSIPMTKTIIRNNNQKQ